MEKTKETPMPTAQPGTTTIKNCSFTGPIMTLEAKDTIIALARAVEENAKAIREITKMSGMNAPMISVGNNS